MLEETQIDGPKHHSQATIARAKALYVVKGIGQTEVATRLNVSSGTVANWVYKYGWVAEREKRVRRLEEMAVKRADDEVNAFMDSLAWQTEDLSEGALEMAREYVDSRGDFAAKNLQAASQSLKNFVDVYFRARGIDGKNTQNVTLNVQNIFASGKPAEKPVFDLGKVDPPKAIE